MKHAPIVIRREPLQCADCGTKPGSPHRNGCAIERCSACGDAHHVCRCPGHDPAFARWTGFLPGSLEACALGLDLESLYSSELRRLLFVKPQ